MRELALEIVCSPELDEILFNGRYKKTYIATRAFEFADAYVELTSGESDFVKSYVRKVMPIKVRTRFASSATAESVVARLVSNAQAIEAVFGLSEDAYSVAKAEKDEYRKRIVEEELARQEKEKKDAEEAKLEEARKAVEETERIKEAERARARKLIEEQEEAAKKARDEAVSIASEVLRTEPVKEVEVEATDKGLSEARVDESGLPEGLVKTLADAGVNTMEELKFWGEASGYDSIPGVGPKAAEKIERKMKSLKGE